MSTQPSSQVYSPREVARAAGVPETRVREALADEGWAADFVTHASAVRLGRTLGGHVSPQPERAREDDPGPARSAPFSLFTATDHQQRPALPLAISGALHAALVAVLAAATSIGFSTGVTAVATEIAGNNDHGLVFIAGPGPGGGGGGGGRLEPAPVAQVLRAGRSNVTSPVPERRPPAPSKSSPEPRPLEELEPLPTVVSPLASRRSDPRDREGSLDSSETSESHGPSSGGGAGLGAGSGIGSGNGPGVGPGSGGGFGGGPFRPGSGIEPPRLLHEVKADYTEAARRAGVEGEVLLEVIVHRDGSVSDITLRRRLGYGLDERAVAAVRQWGFAPAILAGAPVDVIVEIAIEFRLT